MQPSDEARSGTALLEEARTRMNAGDTGCARICVEIAIAVALFDIRDTLKRVFIMETEEVKPWEN